MVNLAIIVSFFISVFILNGITIENLFFSFQSPENVFKYTRFGEIIDVVHGNNSSIVYYSTGNSNSSLIIPKTGKGYKIPNDLSVKRVSYKFDDDGTFWIYSVVGTSDYYIRGVVIVHGNEIDIKDHNNNEISAKINYREEMGITTISINHFVEGFTNDYYLLINDKKVYVAKR